MCYMNYFVLKAIENPLLQEEFSLCLPLIFLKAMHKFPCEEGTPCTRERRVTLLIEDEFT